MAGIDVMSDSTGKAIVDAIKNSATVVKQKEEIEAKGQAVIEKIETVKSTIPGDYTELIDIVDSLMSEMEKVKLVIPEEYDELIGNIDKLKNKMEKIIATVPEDFSELVTNVDELKSSLSLKVESETAVDFSESETPEFQKKIGDILDEVNGLRSDLSAFGLSVENGMINATYEGVN